MLELSPLTRIEGHLAIHAEVEAVGDASGPGAHRIVRARCEGEMFRGFEVLLAGRHPLDAPQIVQRICGVCPVAHGLASIRAQESIYGITPTANGRLLRNLILAADTLHSHLFHFYQLALLDYVDASAVLRYAGRDRALGALKQWLETATAQAASPAAVPAAPFLPRFEGRYADGLELHWTLLARYGEALAMRRTAHAMGAVFAARLPHGASLVPGGCTQTPTAELVAQYRTRLARLAEFIERAYLPDAIAVARAFPQYWEIGGGYGNFLCFGDLEPDGAIARLAAPGVLCGKTWAPLDEQAIAEDVASSWFSSPSRLHPARGQTKAEPRKPGAYSWLKAPRYRGLPMEVGPLARILVNYHSPHPWSGRQEVDRVLASVGVGPEKLVSVMGRTLCRAIEAAMVARQAAAWLAQVEPDAPPARPFTPRDGVGHGLVEAPRGALGHWLAIKDGKIAHYQCVMPTTWNCSPRDDAGQPGPVEKALEGLVVADPKQPLEAGRVVRSFDPCLACAVH
ncbi:MAG: nickel-dependent hydrogenase large subunit [Thermoguttaceae bacterium]|jgi:ferredoxin hydrogenase large subunit/hydrogenase large subunit|nr:nickel-dependent hydrogenase large subunit [Thermoguttaceae bacterium]